LALFIQAHLLLSYAFKERRDAEVYTEPSRSAKAYTTPFTTTDLSSF